MIKHLFIILLLISAIGCDVDIPGAPIPNEKINQALSGTISLTDQQLKSIEGVYSINANSNFGDKSVLKSSPGYISIFCKKNTAFMVLKAGQISNRIIIAGYWRFAQSAEIGFVKLIIDSAAGADKILNGIKPANIRIYGEYESDNTRSLEFNYIDTLVKSDFMIIGHRGGGRNIDRHPASENSLDMLKYCERIGANAVEIDVRLTKDKVPILFHDENLNKRLIREDYFIGKVSDYTFAQLRAFVTLKNGEKIPTLEEALNTIIEETSLKFVWIDTKAIGLIPTLDTIIREFQSKAIAIGRDVQILAGIPDEDIYNEYINYPNHSNLPSICELDEEYVLKAESKIWGPRWSLGLLTDRVLAIQAKDKKVFVWTLDEAQFVSRFLGKSYFNGILTNYPAMVAYEYYTF